MATIDKTYHHLLQTILDDGFTYEDPNRKGINRIQIPSYTFKHDFKDGFPAITTKKLYWKGIVGELIWFLRGDTNIKYLVDNGINIWNKDAYSYYLKQYDLNNWQHNKLTLLEFVENIKKGNLKISGVSFYKLGDLGRVYGAQWRDWKGFSQGLYADFEEGTHDKMKKGLDQISNLIKGLKENPMGTKHIVTAWNPAELDNMALPPCHWSFEVLVEPIHWKSRIDKLEDLGATWESKTDITKVLKKWKIPEYQFTLKWHQRSVDTFLGLPFNIASYALLAQIIGKLTNMKPKGIIGDLSNVHIYKPHLNVVKEQLNRDVNKYNDDVFVNVKHMHEPNDIDKYINRLKISDFILENYKSYPTIPAEMLPYSS